MRAGRPPIRIGSRCVLVASAFVAAATVLAAQIQLPNTIDLVALPVEQEPHHRAVFGNEYIRIIDALFPPLSSSQYHAHLFDNVAVTILSGRQDPLGLARVGFAAFSRGGYAHSVTNPYALPMRFIDVELLARPPAPEFSDPLDRHEIVLSNSRVRVYRVKVDPGLVVTEHRHGAGYVSVVIRGGEPGAWRWHAADDAAGPLVAGRQALEIVEVEPR